VYLISDAQLTLGGPVATFNSCLAPIDRSPGLLTQYHNAATSLKSW
jgi:hypothetical protein